MQNWTLPYTPRNWSLPKIPRAFMTSALSRFFVTNHDAGLASGTLVATAKGWRGVETLELGDQIWTFDEGLQTLMGKKRSPVQPDATGKKRGSLIRIPAYALGNVRDIVCLSTSGILLECQNARDPMGEPYAVVPASSLTGICDVGAYDLRISISMYSLQFNQEQAVYCDSGLPFHFPGLRASKTPRYDLKSHSEAKALMTEADVDALAVREPYEDFFTELVADRA